MGPTPALGAVASLTAAGATTGLGSEAAAATGAAGGVSAAGAADGAGPTTAGAAAAGAGEIGGCCWARAEAPQANTASVPSITRRAWIATAPTDLGAAPLEAEDRRAPVHDHRLAVVAAGRPAAGVLNRGIRGWYRTAFVTGVERGIGSTPRGANAGRAGAGVRPGRCGGIAPVGLAIAAGEARPHRTDAAELTAGVRGAGRARQRRLAVAEAVGGVAGVGAVLQRRAVAVDAAAGGADRHEQRLAGPHHDIVGRIRAGTVVVEHQPGARLIGSAVAVDGTDGRAIGAILAAAQLEAPIVTGAAAAVGRSGTGLSDRLGAAGLLAHGQGRAGPVADAALVGGAVALADAGGAGDLGGRRAHPDLGVRAVRKIGGRVLEAARVVGTIGVVAAERAAEGLVGKIGRGDAERVVRAAQVLAGVGRAGGAERERRRRAGRLAGELKSVAGRQPRADHTDPPAVAEAIRARLGVGVGRERRRRQELAAEVDRAEATAHGIGRAVHVDAS